MYKGRIVDIDVHHQYKTPTQLAEYLPKKWKEYIQVPNTNRTVPLDAQNTRRFGIDPKRPDALPPEGPQGSDYEMMRKQLLDLYPVEIALLTFDVGAESGIANPYLAAAVCRAANDWSADQWLSLPDDRLRGTILIPTELPDEAAKEIRRWADHPKVGGVLLLTNPYGKPFGHPVYHPIYDAAVEVDMPIVCHVAGENVRKGGQHAGGYTGTMLEHYSLIGQPPMHYISSFITHGLFEKFPDLKFFFTEHGFTWVPWVVWRLDASYKLLKKECPWVTELPSTTLRNHVKFSTQPFDYMPRKRMHDLVESFEGFEDMLCFSSDYPHHDGDEPIHVGSNLPREWWPKVFAGNADAFLGARSRPSAQLATL